MKQAETQPADEGGEGQHWAANAPRVLDRAFGRSIQALGMWQGARFWNLFVAVMIFARSSSERTFTWNLSRIRVPCRQPSDFSSLANGDARGAPNGSRHLFLFCNSRIIDRGRSVIRHAVALVESITVMRGHKRRGPRDSSKGEAFALPGCPLIARRSGALRGADC